MLYAFLIYSDFPLPLLVHHHCHRILPLHLFCDSRFFVFLCAVIALSSEFSCVLCTFLFLILRSGTNRFLEYVDSIK
jgi:hypothetical protein